MSKPKITDPFAEFILNNKCEGGCGFTDPFIHTHKLFHLHDKIAPEKCECGGELTHAWTAYKVYFGEGTSFYMSNFVCPNHQCNYRVITPRADVKIFSAGLSFKIVLMDDSSIPVK